MVAALSLSQLFNLPIVDQLVLDVRHRVNEPDHVICALRLPLSQLPDGPDELVDARCESLLLSALAKHVEIWGLPDKCDFVVVYGDAEDEAPPDVRRAQARFITFLQERLEHMKEREWALVRPGQDRRHLQQLLGDPLGAGPSNNGPDQQNNEDDQPRPDAAGLLLASLKRLERTLIRNCQGVRTMAGGYRVLRAAYPFLTGPPGTDASNLAALPSQLHRHLFVGSRPFEASAERLAQLGVAAVVTHNRPERRNILDVRGQVELVNGIEYLHLALRDSDPREDVRAIFPPAADFITRHVDAGRTVLIQLHGRSQSAALGLFWYCLHERVSVPLALAAVDSATRFRVDHRLMYLSQLYHLLAARLPAPDM
ncbi:uncharacterized protein MONBRDRAFT_8551 [Monosiga brevicollis MX1]|uniref:Tyrosine-protein phosphatase domain-containing protein n=1 Tax=Monosiga brevicollis TaxID=81824 RepID=A9V0D1_MONBE|nr:uncharacterized protein MONBRDRAFT_8551 [Monosiga brevicollis MX1]EDQ88990.1 predicted protein [Monosiga brevicollis MX1]|eukprot:XP_001746095.1 hypothetical protein [Monosiga brevicollis MX1]